MAIASTPSHPYTFLVADRPTNPGPVPSRTSAPASDTGVEDEEESTRVAGAPPGASQPGNVVLPNHLHRSGEIEQRDQGPSPQVGDWEEKTVVDDSQLTNPKAALNSLLQGPGAADEELTVDEPQRVLALNLGHSAPMHTVRAQPPPPNRNANGKLVVIAGNDSGREFPLTGKAISVGRGIDNDVVLTDIAVSRKHLSIEFDGTHYTILDVGSGNGTLINDIPGTGKRQVKHGDRLELGNTVFRFEHPATGAHALADQAGAAGAAHGAGPGIPAPRAPGPGPAGGPVGAPGPVARADGAPYPAAQLPAPHGDGASPGAVPPDAAMPGAPPAFPRSQRPQPTPAQVAPAGAGSLVLDEVPSGPKATIGIVATLLAIVALAAIGLLLGDDEELAVEGAPQEETTLQDGDLAAPADAPAMPGNAADGEGGAEHEVADPDTPGPGHEDGQGDGAGAAGGQDGHERSSVDGRIERYSRDARPGEQRPDGAGGDERAGLLWAPIWGTDESILASGTPLAGGDNGGEAVAAAKAVHAAAAALPGDAPEAASTGVSAEAGAGASTVASTAMGIGTQEAAPAPAPAPAVDLAAQPRSPAEARTEARALYTNKDFDAAAQVLRAAAKEAPKKQAKSLRQQAFRYESLGGHLQRATALQDRNAGRAMNEYRQAQQLDRALGGAHAAFLRQRLAAVAPQAAAAYMNEGNHVQAKRAADVAAQHGAAGHAQVERVRQGLEQAAQKKFEEGNTLRRSNPKRAQKLLEEVLRIVPPSSPWHAKAKQLLSLRRKR